LISFQKGVFQGNLLSVTVFNMVINLYIDTITQPLFQSFAYEFSYGNFSLLQTQFADDAAIITHSASACQYLCKLEL
jgi:hypothetical protein